MDRSKSYNHYLWNNRIEGHLMPKIKIKYLDNIITVHEFVLQDNFKTYEILKDNFVGDGVIKELNFNSITTITGVVQLEYKYFELIIKYLYGIEFNLESILLNDLYKIHMFLAKHFTKNISLICEIEDKIQLFLYDLPIININGNKKHDENYTMLCNIDFHCDVQILRHALNKYKYNHFVGKPSYFEEMKLILPHKIIKNMDELFDKYKKYLLDGEIYDYSLSHTFNKYDIGNNKHIPALLKKNVVIENTDNETEIMEKVGYYNLMKYKYYTLSFLNKSFSKINMSDLFDGHYNEYKKSKNLYTTHAILKCVMLTQSNDKNKTK